MKKTTQLGSAPLHEEASPLDKVIRGSVVTAVYRELRRAILQGVLQPQQRLIETEIAARMDVSRTPVREAISKLEVERLVVRQRTGGVVVGDAPAVTMDVYLIRQALEGFAARLACRRATDKEIEAFVQECEEADRLLNQVELPRRAEFDRRFHLGIAAMARSERLQDLIHEYYEYSLNEQSLAQRRAVVPRLEGQHMAVAQAIRSRAEDEAERCMRLHLGTVLEVTRPMFDHKG